MAKNFRPLIRETIQEGAVPNGSVIWLVASIFKAHESDANYGVAFTIEARYPRANEPTQVDPLDFEVYDIHTAITENGVQGIYPTFPHDEAVKLAQEGYDIAFKDILSQHAAYMRMAWDAVVERPLTHK